jgi:hypothetical protein
MRSAIVSSGTARRPGSYGPGSQLQPERAADDKTEVPSAAAAILQKAAEGDGVHHLSVPVQQRRECHVGQSALRPLSLLHLHQLQPSVAGDQFLIVLDVVCERRTQPPHGNYDDPHVAILNAIWTT